MPVDAVVGATWGDEGKGKLTDFLADGADVVVRFQGGRNAGHTIVREGRRIALHLLPSGVLHPDVTNVLGPGVALDLSALEAEIGRLADLGFPAPQLLVSDRCQVVLPYHVLFDELEEDRLGEARFGSTRVGIAPFYGDKALKIGVQLADCLDQGRLEARIAAALVPKNALLRGVYGRDPLEPAPIARAIHEQAARLSTLVGDTTAFLHGALARGARILVEGQLGALRDPDHGVHPWSTSSSPLAGHACVGAGLPPTAFDRIIAVTKAYASCVGATPFVTEQGGAVEDTLRERGHEFGATTGRPRRVGWFDAVATRHGCRTTGATELALTLLDVLDGMERVAICTAYEIDGERTEAFPTTARLERARPVYEWHEGFSGCADARAREALPAAAERYVRRIEELLELPARWLSVGAAAEATIACP